MKLLAVRLARSIWLVPPYFLNPKGLFLRPAVEVMKARYAFLKTPLDAPMPPPENVGYKYELGAFDGKDGAIQINSMTIHSDGVVVDTQSSTESADAFLEDLITWASTEFGLPSLSDLPIQKVYVSELNVVFPRAPVILNPKLTTFLDDVSAVVGDDKKGDAGLVSVQLGTDQTRGIRQGTFRIDREINTSPEENRYYSMATTTTTSHIKLLEKLAKLAA